MTRRRVRYSGKNPRKFHEKYKELNPERYGLDVQKIVESGKTPAGMHRAIMVDEVLDALAPAAGDLAVDCTLGFGGHARAILERIQPGGRLIGLDVDPIELPRTEARLRAAGFNADAFVAHRRNFAGLPQVLVREGVAGADMILADLGVSSMQLDNPDRGFTYKESGPLDMRMNPSRGEPASELLAHLSQEKLARLLEENADEPHAALIAGLLKAEPMATTQELSRCVRAGLASARLRVSKDDVETSIRRTFQALRIAVNDELGELERGLDAAESMLKPGGRLAVVSFHSLEDRQVKAFLAARSATGSGVSRHAPADFKRRQTPSFRLLSRRPLRPTEAEIQRNPRARSAKLRAAERLAPSAGAS